MADSYWSPTTGAWVPVARRRHRPRRWLRYPLATAVLAAGIWFGAPLVTGPDAETVRITSPCPTRSALTWVRPAPIAEGAPHDQ